MEVDHLLAGYDTRLQHALFGARLTAHLVYNFMAEHPLSAAEFLPLPALDAPVVPADAAPVAEPLAAFIRRLEAQLGQPITILTD